MVTRLLLKELVTFKELELSFEPGLVVFTGPSGAGKSVLISAILSSFGHNVKSMAALCELNLTKPLSLKSDAFVLEDEITIKSLKKEQLRYFIDAQRISKKVLYSMFKPYVKHLSVRDQSGLESQSLLAMLDGYLFHRDKSLKKLYKEYKRRYRTFRQKEQMLEKIKEDERLLAEKIEFATFEIEKIAAINPKVEEEEALLQTKQQLSRIDKVRDALAQAEAIFSYESAVEEVYRLTQKDATFFSDTMNQLRADFEEAQLLSQELEEIDVEEVLDRLEALNGLKRRYGSIAEALAYKEAKEQELAGYGRIEQDKSMLEQFLQVEYAELQTLAMRLSAARINMAKELEKEVSHYLASLKLPAINFEFREQKMTEEGMDHMGATLGKSHLETLSGGEFNRLKLALMAATMPQDGKVEGVLILDEIDANVSGDESIAIAELIAHLAQGYQIFAISHQPHLSAKASQHIVVRKCGDVSEAKVLDESERIAEIARIIGGESPTQQAVAFAKKLRS